MSNFKVQVFGKLLIKIQGGGGGGLDLPKTINLH